MNDLSFAPRGARPLGIRRSRCGLVCALSLFGALASACGDDTDGAVGEPTPGSRGGSSGAAAGDGATPALRDPVTSSDEDVAQQALRVLGSSAVGGEGSCRNC